MFARRRSTRPGPSRARARSPSRSSTDTSRSWPAAAGSEATAASLRLSTGTCLLLVITALALESPAMSFALTGVGLIAGLTSRHPFDLVWNHVVRHVAGGPALPRNPTRRRHAFKIATVWLVVV